MNEWMEELRKQSINERTKNVRKEISEEGRKEGNK
jgi:hypothetical protein